MGANRYFLRTEWTAWVEVDEAQWWRAARFASGLTTAPVDFFNGTLDGRIVTPETTPEQLMHDPELARLVWGDVLNGCAAARRESAPVAEASVFLSCPDCGSASPPCPGVVRPVETCVWFGK